MTHTYAQKHSNMKISAAKLDQQNPETVRNSGIQKRNVNASPTLPYSPIRAWI